MAELFEAAMLVCFGLSWPLNALKAYKAGTAKGTSWQFIGLITVGYAAGIAAKFASASINWVLAVYFINVICLGANWLVYFRNRKLDAAADADAARALAEEQACRMRVEEALEEGFAGGVRAATRGI
ncbi:hypothetical protein [Raoultibacter massiliensis]|uniref:hypothetical protein n=1 Tax=Raoultibacter massiliensis TaxID=1852371 RepID=UPI003A95C0D8